MPNTKVINTHKKIKKAPKLAFLFLEAAHIAATFSATSLHFSWIYLYMRDHPLGRARIDQLRAEGPRAAR
jgi:hypothetical protein